MLTFQFNFTTWYKTERGSFNNTTRMKCSQYSMHNIYSDCNRHPTIKLMSFIWLVSLKITNFRILFGWLYQVIFRKNCQFLGIFYPLNCPKLLRKSWNWHWKYKSLFSTTYVRISGKKELFKPWGSFKDLIFVFFLHFSSQIYPPEDGIA